MPVYYGYNMLYFILVLPAVLLAFWAQINVKNTFSRYSSSPVRSGFTGYDSARAILDSEGLYSVAIERVDGNLTDHYDPKANVIRLSGSVYDNASCAAVGVAAHEAGHAIQHAKGYTPMKLRTAIIPVTNFGSMLAMPLVILGILFSYPPIAYAGVIFFGFATLFQLVTLPVEFNASHRAVACLEKGGRLDSDELSGAKKVLRAAALTYVAALAVSLAQLLRVAIIALGSGRRRR